MTLPHDLSHVRNRPGLWFRKPSYDVLEAYLLGIDVGYNGTWLRGFREWLLLKLEMDYRSYGWPMLVLFIAFPDNDDPRVGLESPEGEVRAIQVLFDSLESFLREVGDGGGLRSVYVRYQLWIESNGWCTSTSPDWIGIAKHTS